MGDYVFMRVPDFCINFLCPHMLVEKYTQQSNKKTHKWSSLHNKTIPSTLPILRYLIIRININKKGQHFCH